MVAPLPPPPPANILRFTENVRREHPQERNVSPNTNQA